MNKERFESLYAESGLHYEQNLPSRRLTDSPTDEIDPDAFIANESRCFVINTTERLAVKKALIFSSWYFMALPEESRDELRLFFEELINAGHPFYVPGGDGLVLIDNPLDLEQALIDLKPINTDLAIKLAAENKLSLQSIEVINTRQLLKLRKHLLETSNEGFESEKFELADHEYPRMPMLYEPAEMQEFEDMVDGQQDGYSLDFNANLSIPLYFQDKINLLTLTGSLSDNDVDALCTQFPNLKHLVFKDVKVNADQLSRIINANKGLEKIIFQEDCDLGINDLTLDSDALLHLSELRLSGTYRLSLVPSILLNRILSNAPHLVKLDINYARLTGNEDEFHIPIPQLLAYSVDISLCKFQPQNIS